MIVSVQEEIHMYLFFLFIGIFIRVLRVILKVIVSF